MKTYKFWKDIFVKIVEDTDVVFEVIDARNPLGTRIYNLEEYVKKNAPNVELIIIINKIDLIPRFVLDDWIEYFKNNVEYRFFYVSSIYNRGIMVFKKMLRTMFSSMTVKAIIAGYPNTGKSSLIQALSKDKNKKIGTSSRAGFTRGIMEIKITPSISLYDTPGVIPLSEDGEMEQAIKGIMNPEKIHDIESVAYEIINTFVGIKGILGSFKIDELFIKKHLKDSSESLILKEFLKETNIYDKTSKKIRLISLDKSDMIKKENLPYTEFLKILELIGKKRGFLIQGGDINEILVCTTIVHAWQKNKIKYYVIPPKKKQSPNKKT